MICEMCGSDKNKLLLTEVEGALVKVCPDCARFGKGRKEEKPAPAMDVSSGGSSGGFSLPPLKKKGAYSKDVFDRMGDDELVDDYGKVIRRSREALHLSQEDLAKKINEKKSIIAKLESGNMVPSDDLVKKLEKALLVKLKEKYVAKSQTLKPKGSGGPVTLGDLVKYDD
jgi:putative transcription factor